MMTIEQVQGKGIAAFANVRAAALLCGLRFVTTSSGSMKSTPNCAMNTLIEKVFYVVCAFVGLWAILVVLEGM